MNTEKTYQINEFIAVANNFSNYIAQKVNNGTLNDATSKRELQNFNKALDKLIESNKIIE